MSWRVKGIKTRSLLKTITHQRKTIRDTSGEQSLTPTAQNLEWKDVLSFSITKSLYFFLWFDLVAPKIQTFLHFVGHLDKLIEQ